MSNTYTGVTYLDQLRVNAERVMEGVTNEATKWNQYEISSFIGHVIAGHDSQEGLLFRTALRKTNANTNIFDEAIGPAIDALRSIRVRVLALGMTEKDQAELLHKAGAIYTGANILLPS